MTRPLSCVALASVVLAAAGCSYSCHFEARGAVRDGATGRPIPNALVKLVAADGGQLADPVAANQQGEFQVTFARAPSGAEEVTGWKLLLSADGYEPEAVEVGPVKEPKRGDVTVYLIFHAAMRQAR